MNIKIFENPKHQQWIKMSYVMYLSEWDGKLLVSVKLNYLIETELVFW